MAALAIPESAKQRGFAMARAGDGSPILAVVRSPLPPAANPDHPNDPAARRWIGVDGAWYDVSALLDRHPGGDIIKEFVGRDATEVFHQYHDAGKVLRHRRPVAHYSPEELAKERFESGPERDYRALQAEFTRDGWYRTDMRWFAGKLLVVAGFLTLAFASAAAAQGNMWLLLGVTAPALALFWQQSGFFMHDFMHSEIFQDARVDRLWGTFFGTVCLGVSGSWWRDEHFEHHTFTNTFEDGVINSDPQMQEVVWMQDPQLAQFFEPLVRRFVIPFQHYIFLPLLIFVGRFGIMIDSMASERRLREWLCWMVHWAWVAALLSLIPGWKRRLVFYYVASCLQGVLHIQLLISHYDKPFVCKQASKRMSIFERQARAVKDIRCPWWLDWFHGGLNLHMAHHLFPRLPRHRLAAATERVRQICVKHGIPVDDRCWSDAVGDCIRHLRGLGELKLTLDIRK